MKTPFWLSLIGIVEISLSVKAQGTPVYGQQSSTTESGLQGGVYFQSMQPFGQSFVPSLSSMDFIRLYMEPGGPGDVTVYVNLPRSVSDRRKSPFAFTSQSGR